MSGIHQEIDMRDAEQQFEEFFASLGIPLPRGGLKLDRRIHRFQIGDRSNTNGAYQFWPEGKSYDGRPHGWVQNWSDGGTKHHWQYKLERGFIYKPSADEIAAKKQQEYEQDEARRAKAIAKARQYFASAPVADRDHPYLVRKGITDHRGELRQYTDQLLVPYRCIVDPERPIGTVQFIPPDGGGKKSAKGVSPIAGDAAYLIDGDAGSSRVFIAEGMATAESIALALSLGDCADYRAVLAAGSCGRLRGVAEAARAVWPDAQIYMMADDDFRTQLKNGRNPGLDSANAIVRDRVADAVIMPPFPRDHGDASSQSNEPTDWNDFAVMHGRELTRSTIERLIREHEGEHPPNDDLPTIVEDELHLRECVAKVTSAFVAANAKAGEPVLYVSEIGGRGGLARVSRDSTGRAFIEHVTISNAGLLMSNVANFMRVRKGKDGGTIMKPAKPTKDIITSFVNAGEWDGLPKLCGVSRMPIVRHDGSIHNEPGYDPISCAYYDEVDRVVIPEHPTRDDAARAAAVLCDALCDFPFAGAEDCDMHYQSNMIGFEVSIAFLFADIGHIPMLVIDAPRRGTGKSLLTQHGGVIMTGEQVGSVSASGDDGEWRKLLTSAFKDGTQFLAFDNIDEKITIDSPSLAMALTTGWFSDRLLHTNTNVKLKRRCVMVMNGNNLKLGPDILRRTYRVRIDDGNVSASDERRFSHPERVGSTVLVEWLKRNRAKLVGAICTMIRAWYEADCPKWRGHVIESFEEFCRTIGGILQYAGLDDFLRGAVDDQRSMGDDDEAQWGAFLCGIHDWTGETPFTAKSLVAKCKASPELAALVPDKVGTVDSKFFNAYIVGSLLGHRIDTKFRSDSKIVKLTKAAAGGHDKNAWSVQIISE